jgi:hypothetical protein
MEINNFIKNGYLVTNEILNEDEIISLREEIDKEFIISGNQVAKKLVDFKNISLVKKIINLYNHSSIQSVLKEIRIKYNTEVALLPTFVVHKNYHVNLKEFHGWHRDCGGELRYNYCKDIIYTNDYFFSKIGFYLQKNEDYGGSIDIIKNSHKNFSKNKVFFRKIKNIPLRIVMLFHKYLNKFYNSLPEKLIMLFLNAKKLNPKVGTAVFFDSRIIHRGSPISKKNLDKVEFKKGKYHANLPKNVNKFTIYCQIGNTKSIDSYMFDRLNKVGNSDELKFWINEINAFSRLDKNLLSQTNLVLNPIKEKYKKYLE